MKAIIFDLDGTLWDSSSGVLDAWNKILEKYNISKLDIDFMQSIMGKNMDEIKKLIFKENISEETDRIYQECLDYENDFLRENGAEIYPELENVLNTLSEKYSLAVVSNCQSGYIEAFLSYYKLEKYFIDIECYGNTLKEKNENIKSVVERNNFEKAYYVGDTLGDYNFATAAGTEFIHAAYGFGKVPQAKYSISKLKELPALMEKIDENTD